jgi:hypothetical protein
VLTEAYDALDAREPAASVWRRLLKGHDIKQRTWEAYATRHVQQRQARAEWSQLSICRRLSPKLIRACKKHYCLQVWARLRRQPKHKAQTKGGIDRLACAHVRDLYPDLRVTPRTLARWRQRYARLVASDRFAATVADLLGITLSTRRRT